MQFEKKIIELKQISALAAELSVKKGVSWEDGLLLDSISSVSELVEANEKHQKAHDLFQKKNKEVIQKAQELFEDDEQKRESYIKNTVPDDYKGYIDEVTAINNKVVKFEFATIPVGNFKSVEEEVRGIVFFLKKQGLITA